MTAVAPVVQSLPLREAEVYWKERVRSAVQIALFLDFDGTISPIVAAPELAAIDPQIKSTLEQLRNLEGVQIAIVSGRQLIDVRARAGVDGILYAGNHGLEIETDVLCFREPRAESLRLELRRLILRLQVTLSEVTGIEIEEKGLSAAIHYRQVHESLHQWVRQIVWEAVCKSQLFTCVNSKMAIDVRPNVPWNKGDAVKWLLTFLPERGTYPIFIGDDTTDEDAFAALNGEALTIRVGEAAHTAARFWVPDLCAVRAFLSELYDIRRKEAAR
jgi:trehalose-phosphatase